MTLPALILFAAFAGLLLALIVAGYLYNSCPWHFCPCCAHFWHIKTKERTITMPAEAEGICKPRTCECCDK